MIKNDLFIYWKQQLIIFTITVVIINQHPITCLKCALDEGTWMSCFCMKFEKGFYYVIKNYIELIDLSH